MKRFFLLTLLLVLLTGCGRAAKEIERGMALRSKLLNAVGCSFDAEITADYGDKLHTFAMTCRGNEKGDLNFTVTGPETIAGITGCISREAGKLTFEDTALYFEMLVDGQVTPISAPWILLKTLRGGCLTSACEEDGLLRLSMDDSYEEDALHLDIWLNEADQPVRGEILYKERRILSLSVTNFEIS